MDFARLPQEENFMGNFIVKKNSTMNFNYQIKNHFDYRTVGLVATTDSHINLIRWNL